jgi:hypothetical protein
MDVRCYGGGGAPVGSALVRRRLAARSLSPLGESGAGSAVVDGPVTRLCCAGVMDKDLTPAQRSLRARIAAHASWANTSDRSARTAAARRAALDRFERQVDPNGALPAEERALRAASSVSPLIFGGEVS